MSEQNLDTLSHEDEGSERAPEGPPVALGPTDEEVPLSQPQHQPLQRESYHGTAQSTVLPSVESGTRSNEAAIGDVAAFANIREPMTGWSRERGPVS